MVHKPSFLGVSAALILCSVASGQTVDGSQYNKPSAGPPASFFAAATTLPVAAIKSAAAKATKVPKSATYVINNESDSPKATIHSDWANLNKVRPCCLLDLLINQTDYLRVYSWHRALHMFSLLTWTLTVMELTISARYVFFLFSSMNIRTVKMQLTL
jgi:hypothetical protein